MRTDDTDRERSDDRDALGRFKRSNRAATGKGYKRTLTRRLREATEAEITKAGVPQAEAAAVARDALRMYRAYRRNLASGAAVVLAPTLRAATNTALGAYYTTRAAAVGLDTDKGMKLLDVAHKCETRADRSMVAAVTLATQPRRPGRPSGTGRYPWLNTTGADGSDCPWFVDDDDESLSPALARIEAEVEREAAEAEEQDDSDEPDTDDETDSEHEGESVWKRLAREAREQAQAESESDEIHLTMAEAAELGALVSASPPAPPAPPIHERPAGKYMVKGPGKVKHKGQYHSAGAVLQLGERDARSLGDAAAWVGE